MCQAGDDSRLIVAVLYGEDCIVATEIPAWGLHNLFSPKMSSQAKVKKDKEIIAEYETQVKGW